MRPITAHDLVVPRSLVDAVAPRRRGNPLFVTGSDLHPKRLRGYAVRRFFEAAFRRQFGLTLDEMIAEAIDRQFAEVIAELQSRADAGDEGARALLAKKLLDRDELREVRCLLKAPAKTGRQQAA